MSDSNGRMNKDSAYYWLGQLQSPYADLTKVDLLLNDSNVAAANSLYNAITSTYTMPDEETSEFSVWGRKLMDVRINLTSNGRQMTELNTAQVVTLDSVATYATMWAKVRAQNWLSLYDGRAYEHDFLFPEDDASSNARKAKVASQQDYKVYPNPVSEYLSVAYTNSSDKGAVLQIVDVVGRVMIESSLAGETGSVDIDMRSLQSGVYLYHILENGKTVKTGRVTKH